MNSASDPSLGDDCDPNVRGQQACSVSTPAPSVVDAATTNVFQSGFTEPGATPIATTVPGDDQNPEGGAGAPSGQSPTVVNTIGTVQTFETSAATRLVTSITPTSTVPVVAASSSNTGSSLSTGAVAGIAIAMLFAGAAIAFLVAFVLFKRRNKNRDANVAAAAYTSYADSSPELVMMQQKSVGLGGRNSPYVQVSQTPASVPTLVAAPAPTRQSHSADVASFLPPAAHENAIHSRVSALFGQIHHHIESYYRDVHASITPSMEPELARFGAKDVNMAELLQNCSSPTTALKHALVAYVLGTTGPKNDEDGETLFPEELNGVRVQDGQDAIVSDSTLAAATSLHRRLSVYLYTSTSSTSNPRRSWIIQSNIREAAEHFSLTFFPWANPTASDQDREDDLVRIISEALELRIWLFGQPSSYEFEWEGTGRRGVLVNPGLVRRTGERGEENRRIVVEGAVVAM